MYKSLAILGLALISQVAVAGYNCSNGQGVQITVQDKSNQEAIGTLNENGKITSLNGAYSVTNDTLYKIYKYEMMSPEGAKADLTISYKLYEPGGGCNRRNCNNKSFTTMTSKLSFDGKETYLSCDYQ
ncbi:hypothetical protein [Peredibacter starrii]|uniref:Uncharacterized protein n=1 Tax=Peredibacter starrii TaxID=28202 RepID=A0AAX4HJ96_9BACT|nr:hypothetical protein [Peredibacter starrii]WPU63297.1 hypothetical protein SOO65_11435 [Peredibacter starrii]